MGGELQKGAGHGSTHEYRGEGERHHGDWLDDGIMCWKYRYMTRFLYSELHANYVE